MSDPLEMRPSMDQERISALEKAVQMLAGSLYLTIGERRYAEICNLVGIKPEAKIETCKHGNPYDDCNSCSEPESSSAAPWATYMEIFPHSQNKIWVRWTGIDGIYRWLHPETRTWVEEPHQVNMPFFSDYAEARKAADESPEPPTWAEYAAKTDGR